jgi:hypothetical protein
MKNNIIVTVLVSWVVLSGNLVFASSDAESYIGVQYAAGMFSQEGLEDINPGALVVRFGEQISDGFSLEGRVGMGVGDDGIVVGNIETVIEVDTIVGVYGVGRVDISDIGSVYGVIGFSRGEFTILDTSSSFSATFDDGGESYGLGVDINIGGSAVLNIEYMSYLSKTDFDYSALGLGVVFKF